MPCVSRVSCRYLYFFDRQRWCIDCLREYAELTPTEDQETLELKLDICEDECAEYKRERDSARERLHKANDVIRAIIDTAVIQ